MLMSNVLIGLCFTVKWFVITNGRQHANHGAQSRCRMNADSAVRTGQMGIKKASGVFRVPKTTLRRRARDKNKLAKDGTRW